LGITFITILLGLIAYIGFLGQLKLKPDFRFATPQLIKEMMSYSGFNMLVGLGGILTQKVDAILVPSLLNFSSGAIFGFGGMIAEAIDVPRKALAGISAPLISESIKKGNVAHVEEIYKKTALLQLIVGLFLLVGVWVCADALFDLMPKNGDLYRQGKIIILLLGLARVVDMATGVNAEIITYSEHYRFNLKSFVVLAVLNLILNIVFIPIFGITGSALATLISITAVNIWRLLFIKQKLGIHPLTSKMLRVVLFAFIAYVVGFYTPSVGNAFLTIILKGIVVTVIYGLLILKFKISDDVNHTFNSIIKTIVR
jgi:O-antigen/teichoic acid export membrane protein